MLSSTAVIDPERKFKQTLNYPAYRSRFFFGHMAEPTPQKIPTNAARPQSGSCALLTKLVEISVPAAVPDAVIRKFFIVRKVIAELSMIQVTAVLASAPGPDCVKTRDWRVFRGPFTIPELEKTP